MVWFHSLVGTLVVLSYLALTVLYVLALGGRSISWVRPFSFIAATLLLLQYLLGFGLLGAGHRNQASHYAFALLAILTVGMEHGYARRRPTAMAQARSAAVATGLTTVLVVAAYVIGQRSG